MSTFTHALSTNNYGTAKFVVATSAANGTHTTLASAMAAASAGDTIFLRDSVTENVTITPGVNIAAWHGSALNTPSITGKLTMTGAGTSTISGIELITNSDFAIAITGSVASILNVNNCYLNFSNNTGISFTTSSSSALLFIQNSNGNLGTTGIAYFAHSSAGTLRLENGLFDNTGASTTANTCSAGNFFPARISLGNPTTISSTGIISASYTFFNEAGVNSTALTITSATTHTAYFCNFASGTASAISVGSGATFTVDFANVISSNTNAITGAGTIQWNAIAFGGSSSTINTTTQNHLPTNAGSWSLIQTQLASASSAISFTSIGSFTNYIIVLTDIFPSVNGVQLQFQYSTNGGSTYANTGYAGVVWGDQIGQTFHALTTTSSTAAPVAHSSLFGTTPPGGSGNIYLYNLTFLNSHGASYVSDFVNNNSVSNRHYGWGILGNGAAINALQIACASGTFSGKLSIYGVNI